MKLHWNPLLLTSRLGLISTWIRCNPGFNIINYNCTSFESSNGFLATGQSKDNLTITININVVWNSFSKIHALNFSSFLEPAPSVAKFCYSNSILGISVCSVLLCLLPLAKGEVPHELPPLAKRQDGHQGHDAVPDLDRPLEGKLSSGHGAGKKIGSKLAQTPLSNWDFSAQCVQDR